MAANHLSDHFRSGFGSLDDIFMRSPGGGDIVTYGALLARSAQFANMLVDLGVEPGDRIAVQAAKSIDAFIFYVAVIRCGAVYLPLNTGYTPAEVDYFLNDAEPAVLVTDTERLDDLRPLAEAAGIGHTITLEPAGPATILASVEAAPESFEDVARGRDDLAALLYTSGTTGRSKGAMLTHGNLASNALALREAWQFTGRDVLIHALPIFHTHGLFVATNVTLAAGGSMIVLPKFDIAAVIGALGEATCLMGVPTHYTRLIASGRLTPGLCGHMRLFVSGSAPLLSDTHDDFRRATGHAILERYGMTETSMITSNPYDGERQAGRVGFPLPGIEVRVADAGTGAPVAHGDIGVIEVRGPNVFSGYWRMPEKTRSEFREDGFFITGDLGQIDDTGYLAIVGRGKDLIISGGLNVYPKEVEGEIDALPGVLESAVVGVPHPDFGEAVIAVVVAAGDKPPDPEALAGALASRLARFKQPKAFYFINELPRNTMGKIQKNSLRDTYNNIFSSP